MRRIIASPILLVPLLAGCTFEDPILPELKGRWSAPAMINAMEERRPVEQFSMKAAAPTTQAEMCRAVYVTFGKRAIRASVFGRRVPSFSIDSAKREGSRIVLKGRASNNNAESAATIELVLRNGEVHFDDIYDATAAASNTSVCRTMRAALACPRRSARPDAQRNGLRGVSR
jgi:hypothetical protein